MEIEGKGNGKILAVVFVMLFLMLLFGILVAAGVIELFTVTKNVGPGDTVIDLNSGNFTGLDESGNLKSSPLDDSQAVLGTFMTNAPSGKYYLRMKSFGDFKGNGWNDSVVTDSYSNNPMYLTLMRAQKSGYTEYDATVHMYSEQILMPYYSTKDDIVEISVDKGIKYKTWLTNYDYFADPNIGNVYDSYLTSLEKSYRNTPHAGYMNTYSLETRALLINYARNYGIKENDSDIIQKIAECVKQSMNYNRDLNWTDYTDGENMVEYMLTGDKKEGVCAHYATIATLMYRAFGFPARYVTGVAVDSYAPGMEIEITARDAHAWVEVYIDGLGWVNVEVTGGSNDSSKVLIIETDSAEKIYDGKPLSTDGFSIIGALGDGEQVILGDFPSITEPSTEMNTCSVKIVDKNGEDVTDKYNIQMLYGTLSIYRGSVYMKTESYAKPYDGIPLNGIDYLDITEKILLPGDSIEIISSPTIVEPGSVKNVIKYAILNEYGINVTEYYDITEDFGYLSIKRGILTVESGSASKYYDGTPLSAKDTFNMASGSLYPGDKIVIDANSYPEITEVGSKVNNVEFVIRDAGNKIVTDEYSIAKNFGTLTVMSDPNERPEEIRKLTIVTESASKKYDGTPLFAEKFEITSGSLYAGHTIIAENYPQIIEEGSVKNIPMITIRDKNGIDVKENYNITFFAGTLSVYREYLYVSTTSASKVYDGTPLTGDGTFSITDGKLDAGHSLNITHAQITDIGKVKNIPTIVITDENGKNVTDKYFIIGTYGDLTVYRGEITIETDSAEKYYDGTPLSAENTAVITDGKLYAGDKLLCSDYPQITEVGIISNSPTVMITDENGDDVTDEYIIKKSFGKLVVKDKSSGGGSGDSGSSGGDGGSLGLPNGGGLTWGSLNDSNKSVLAIVTSNKSGSIYLRYKSFGAFNGVGWDELPKSDKYIGNPMLFTYNALSESGLKASHAEVTLYTNQFMLPYYSRSNAITYTSGNNEISYFVDYVLYDYLNDGYFSNIGEWLSAEQIYREFVYENYLDTYDNETLEVVLNYAKEHGIDADSDNLIEQIAQCVRQSLNYNLKLNWADYKAGDNMLIYMLTGDKKEGVCQHYATIAAIMYRAFGIPARYTTGVRSDTTAGKAVDITSDNAHAWVEIYIDGLGWVNMEVTGGIGGSGGGGGSSGGDGGDGGDGGTPSDPTKPTITVSTESAEKIYDGVALSAKNSLKLVSGELMEGHKLYASDYPSITDVGIIKNEPGVFKVVDESGNDVTSSYNVKKDYGSLTVKQRDLYIQTQSGSWIYNGEAHSVEQLKVISALASCDRIVSLLFPTIKYVGEVENKPTLNIFNLNGSDSSKNYRIIGDFGKLIVTPRKLSIKTGTAIGTYDGNPLICADYRTLSGSIAGTDRLVITEHTEQREFGVKDNILKIKLENNDGNDVTSQYELGVEYGTLTLEKAKAYIETGSAEKAYDGKALTCREFKVTVFGTVSESKNGEGITLANGDIITVEFNAQRTEKGYVSNTLEGVVIKSSEGEDVTDYYSVIILSYGTLLVY